MSNFDALIQDLVIANRILAREEVVDAYGHVSIRHPDNPDHFLIARSLAPELVGPDDIVELDLAGQPVRSEDRNLYLERFIHAAIFAARTDVMAVVHAHAEDTLPFGIVDGAKLRPVIHSGSFIGAEVPVWDIADHFGDTNLLVTNMAQAEDLAKCLGGNSVALMRGHGFAAAARSLIDVVRLSVYLPRNARALMRAIQLGGEIKYLSPGEIAARNRGYSPYSVETWRAWNIGRTRPAAATCWPAPISTPVAGSAEAQGTRQREHLIRARRWSSPPGCSEYSRCPVCRLSRGLVRE